MKTDNQAARNYQKAQDNKADFEMFTRSFVGMPQDDFLQVCAMLSQNNDFRMFDIHSFSLNRLILMYKLEYTILPDSGQETLILNGLKRDLEILNPFIREVIIDRVLVRKGESSCDPLAYRPKE